jgi:hypothetical protein
LQPARRRGALVLAAALCFLSRVPFLSPTLDDIDSVNYALALERFDPTLHQPHAPGYPLEVAAARMVAWFFPEPVVALSLVSALAQALVVFPLYALFAAFGSSPRVRWTAIALTLCCPVVWLNGGRAESDSLGLLAAMSAAALLVEAPASPKRLLSGSFLAGLAPGARLQSIFLTGLPFLRAVWKSTKGRLGAIAAAIVGTLLWVAPVLVASGGARPYARAFAETMGQAAESEPLFTDLSLNRIARALEWVFLRPWGSPVLALAVLALAALGALSLLRDRRASLILAGLVFAPYLLLHFFVQEVECLKYSLLYIPCLAFLAVEGAESLRWPGRVGEAGLVAASIAIAVPALWQYSTGPSPIFRALEEIDEIAVPADRFVLSGHYQFSRFFPFRTASIELLAPPSRSEVQGLEDYWKSGGERDVLFLAEPGRTDLESIAPDAKTSLAVWEWPPSLAPLLSGTRPGRVELLALTEPRWFVGKGWLLSLENVRQSDRLSVVEREAFLRAYGETTFLLLAGEPLAPCEGVSVSLELSGTLLGRHSCNGPLLTGIELSPATADGFGKLVARTERGGTPVGSAFALRGLDYGPRSTSGLVCGEGFFYPEPDEQERPFRWASKVARCLAHVPEPGAILSIEGVAPLEYLGRGVRVGVAVEAAERAGIELAERSFRLEVPLDPGLRFAAIELRSSRSFVPDDRQKNGDMRELALRVYSMRVETVDSGLVSSR